MSDGVNFHSSRDSNSKIGEALTYRLQESLLQRVNMPSSDMPCRVHALELFHQWLPSQWPSTSRRPGGTSETTVFHIPVLDLNLKVCDLCERSLELLICLGELMRGIHWCS